LKSASNSILRNSSALILGENNWEQGLKIGDFMGTAIENEGNVRKKGLGVCFMPL
jgi:hypothetical protein